MDFTLDAEQIALRDAVRGLLGKAYDSSETRREVTKTDPGWDDKTWQQLAEMGALGLPFAEEDGGLGAGPVEVSIVAEEIGPRHRARAVRRGGRPGRWPGRRRRHRRAARRDHRRAGRRARWCPRSRTPSPARRYSETATGVTASSSGDGWTLTGVKEPVLGGARADLLIVSAAVRRRDRPVPGPARRRGPDPHVVPRPSTADAPRTSRSSDTRRPRWARPGADQSAAIADGDRPGADRLRPRGARRDGDRAGADHRVPQDAQAVRRPADDVPGADVPGRRHVRLARARPQHRHLGDAGPARRQAMPTSRRRRAPSCRSARPAGTSARRRSSCTAASA